MSNNTASTNRKINVEVGLGPLPLGTRFRANAEIMLAWLRRTMLQLR